MTLAESNQQEVAAMLTLSLCGVSDLDSQLLADQLRVANGSLKLLANVPSLVFANSYAEIASARLAVWYIAELLADHGDDVKVQEIDHNDGSSDVEFQCVVAADKIDSLASKLWWMAPAFDQEDEDNDMHQFDFGCEIEGWLEDRDQTLDRFPALREAYEQDAQAADEQLGRDKLDD
jgi:hypothetical protein